MPIYGESFRWDTPERACAGLGCNGTIPAGATPRQMFCPPCRRAQSRARSAARWRPVDPPTCVCGAPKPTYRNNYCPACEAVVKGLRGVGTAVSEWHAPTRQQWSEAGDPTTIALD